jgi:hypothetical protein
MPLIRSTFMERDCALAARDAMRIIIAPTSPLPVIRERDRVRADKSFLNALTPTLSRITGRGGRTRALSNFI